MNIDRLFELVPYQLENFPQDVCLAEKKNDQWITYSTQQVYNRINNISCWLLDQGISPRDKIGIISFNCPAWVLTDYAILQIGAIDVPMYPNSTTEDYEYIIQHADIKYVFVGDEDIRQKVDKISGIEIISFNRPEFEEIANHPQDRVNEIATLQSQIQSEDTASIIYTSGTTGRPKGVMLSHHNILSNVDSGKEILDKTSLKPGSRILSFLPLCHIFERTGSYLDMYTGASIYFAESIEKIGDNMREVHPELLRVVPRLLEKIYEKILTTGHGLSGIKKQLFFWTVNLVSQYNIHQKGSWWYRKQLSLADKLILSKWREALGGKVVVILCGAASLRPSLVNIFWASRMPVLEGYGLTETSPVVSISRFSREDMRAGCVGPPLENVSVKIAEDGEILVKGPNVMQGYYRQPEETDQVFTSDGWFKTGDIGEMVEGRFLRITDRKKEIFKTSGGKYIAPQPLEVKLKESLYVEQAMVVGENQKFPGAIILPAWDQVDAYCKRHGIEASRDNMKNPAIHTLFQREVDKANESFARFEQIKEFRLIEGDWTVDNGMMTPTLKLKRRMIYSKYQDIINSIYERQESVKDSD
jgi:long-chain acyl-CoA synthetase